MTDTFTFCPGRYVPETIPPEPLSATTFNGWAFTSKPEVPYQKRFKVTLHGLRWYTDGNGYYDATTNANFNARALELFYESHQTWSPFFWTHQHLGSTPLLVRFMSQLIVPAAPAGSGGWLDPLEMTLVHHNPGYS